MLKRIQAIKKALSQGWVPEYEGTASGWNDKLQKSELVLILSDSNHRCVQFHTFENLKEYYHYHSNKKIIWNRKKLSPFYKSVIKFLQEYK